MSKYHGSKGAFYEGTSSGGAAANVANLTDWKLDVSQDIAEVSCLGDTWKSFVAGLKGATGSFSGYFADDADSPFDAFDAGASVKFYGYPAGSAVARYWYGSVWPTQVSVDVPVNGPVAISGNMTVDGTLGRIGT